MIGEDIIIYEHRPLNLNITIIYYINYYNFQWKIKLYMLPCQWVTFFMIYYYMACIKACGLMQCVFTCIYHNTIVNMLTVCSPCSF